MRHTFEAEQWLPYSVDHVFAFFANPENLPRLMPPWQKARIEEAAFAPPSPRPSTGMLYPGIVAGAGTRMTISFRPVPYSPLRVPWDAEITEFVWNEHFCDVQHRGPFAYWRHCHRLNAETRPTLHGETPGTLLHDHVEYELPLGRLGRLERGCLLRRNFDRSSTSGISGPPRCFPCCGRELARNVRAKARPISEARATAKAGAHVLKAADSFRGLLVGDQAGFDEFTKVGFGLG